MFGYLPVGQILRVVRVTDKILPRLSSSLLGRELFERLSRRRHFSERVAVAVLLVCSIGLHPVTATRD